MSEAHDGAPEGVSEDTTVADDLAIDAIDAANPVDQPGDDAAAEADAEGEGDPPKPKRSPQERINEVLRQKREIAEAKDREIEFWKAKATGGEQPKPGAEQPKEDAEPDPAEFQYGETDPGYIRALARFEGRQAYREEAAKDRQQTQARTVEQTWTARGEAFAAKTPDFHEVINKDDLPISRPMADAIRTSEFGPEVAYHLAKNPDEARRINGLTPLAAVREIGRLEARFDTKAGAPPLKPASDAPAPPAGVRGNGGRFAVSPDTTDFQAFEKLADAKG